MPTVQIWLDELDIERLKTIREFIARSNNPDRVSEGLLDEYAKGGMSVTRRRRPKLNNSLMIRRAIQELSYLAESYLIDDAKRRAAKANGTRSSPTRDTEPE
jgi:hypothetical protein